MVLRLSPNENTMWFVYQGSRSDTHYLGPYSSREFVERTVAGDFDDSVFVWTHGMEDWRQLSKQPDLELFFLELKAAREKREAPRKEFAEMQLSGSLGALDFETSPSREHSASDEAPPTIQTEFHATNDLTEAVVDTGLTADLSGNLTAAPEIDSSFLARTKRHRVVVAFGFLVLATAAGWLLTATRTAWVPRGTVASEELDELTRAKTDSLRFSGPSVAIAIAKSDITAPSFYVATNLANDTRLDIRIEGLPETLVDRFKYSMQATLTVNANLAHTPVLRETDGSGIRRGAYKVSVTERGQSKILAQKVYFLGGAQDLSYQADLTRFHQSLRRQAAAELEEISQLNETVSHQIAESNMRFSELVRDETLNGPTRRVRWTKFQETWNLLTVQFIAIIDSWTPTRIENEFYYSSLYSKLQRAAVLMASLHETQTRRLDANADRATLNGVIAKTAMNAQTLVEEIRNQTERLKVRTSQQPSAGNSLPSRADDGT